VLGYLPLLLLLLDALVVLPLPLEALLLEVGEGLVLVVLLLRVVILVLPVLHPTPPVMGIEYPRPVLPLPPENSGERQWGPR